MATAPLAMAPRPPARSVGARLCRPARAPPRGGAAPLGRGVVARAEAQAAEETPEWQKKGLKGNCPCNGETCDGSGRIAGGMGAIFDWWPIKVYRQCPVAEAEGRVYTPKGQALDDILFGGKGKE